MERERRPGKGTLLLAAGMVALSLGSAHAGGEPADLIEMEVLGVMPLEAETASLLVLRQKGAGTVLPIFVGRQEGAAIERRLKEPTTRGSVQQRPDLLATAIDALGGKVSRVAIDGAQAALFSARVTLEQGDRRIEVEARPSDSVALAIAAHAPIYATRHVVAEAGLTKQDLARAERGARKRDADRERSADGEAQSF